MPRKKKYDQKRFSSYSDSTEMTLRSLFSKYDENDDGVLNGTELTAMFKDDFALTTDEAEVYHYLLDKDGDGTISFDEFNRWFNSDDSLKFVYDKSRYHVVKSAIDLFKKFDVDSNFSLDRDELKTVIVAFGGDPASIDVAEKQLDKDGNGKISFPEFLAWLNWIPIEDLLFTRS